MPPVPPDELNLGVAFPRAGDDRSTSATGRAVFADAARAVDRHLATTIEAERDWRGRYLVHARALLEARLRSDASPDAVAAAGLSSLHDRFVFVRDGQEVPLPEAFEHPGPPMHTAVVTGRGDGSARQLSVPYRGRRLSGTELHHQLDHWTAAGVVEPSFAEAIRAVMANPDWLDLSDRSIVVFGAGAEMGPLVSLAAWGATLIPVDLDRPAIWHRIIDTVRQGRGRALVPVTGPVPPDAEDELVAQLAGADLVTRMPEVGDWLQGLDGPLTLGNYVYADGAAHVRVSMAVDAITVRLLEARLGDALAVLATPTDVFAVPQATVEDSQRRGASGVGRVATRGVRAVTRGRLFAPNYDGFVMTAEGPRLGIADCLVKQQGPNYALAKRLQRWRASVARSAGTVTSINVAPPTRTRSVLRNRLLAAGYAGAHRFGIEVFDPSTSNTLMAAMLVHDLRNDSSVANPATELRHPLQLLWEGANHGGLWRNPHAARSVLTVAVALGMLPRGA